MTIRIFKILYDNRIISKDTPSRSYRVRERVRFLHLPPEIIQMRQAPLPPAAQLNQAIVKGLMDWNDLKSDNFKHTPDVRGATQQAMISLHKTLGRQGLTFPLFAIAEDPRIDTWAKIGCYTHLMRAYFLDYLGREEERFLKWLEPQPADKAWELWRDIYEEKNPQISIGNTPLPLFRQGHLARANEFLFKLYVLCRYYPEVLEENQLTTSVIFADGRWPDGIETKPEQRYGFPQITAAYINPFLTANFNFGWLPPILDRFSGAELGPAYVNSISMRVSFLRLDDEYLAFVPRTFPLQRLSVLINYQLYLMRNVVFYEHEDLVHFGAFRF